MQYDEGHTVAGWAGAAVATVGALGLALGVVGWRPGLWAGGVALVLAALLTWLLHLAGWGKAAGPRAPETWRMRERDTGARGGHAGCLACRIAGRGGGESPRSS